MSAYRKLVTGSGAGSRTYLYRGSDHLLLVEGSYLEEYRRFFYPDIQAALWVPNRLYPWALGFLAAVLVAGGIALYLVPFLVAAWLMFVPAALIFVRLAYVLARGGYCTFYLHTAAQYTRIRGISTVSKARKITGLIETMTPPPAAAPPPTDMSS